MARQPLGAVGKGSFGLRQGRARGGLACWRGNGPPRRRSVAGLRGRSATLGLRHGPDSYGRQQWGILRNGRKPDAATPRGGRRLSGCKPLSGRTKLLGLIAQRVTVLPEEAPANYVPAAAAIRRGQALSGFIGRKERVGGHTGPLGKLEAQPGGADGNRMARVRKRRVEFLV